MERQLGEAKKGLAEANREGQSAAAKFRALHAELEEVRMDVIMLLLDVMLFSKMSTYMTLVLLDLMLAVKVRSQKEKGEEVEVELQRQLGRLKGEVGNILV